MSTSNFFFELVVGLGQLKTKSDRALRSRARPNQCALFLVILSYFFMIAERSEQVLFLKKQERGSKLGEFESRCEPPVASGSPSCQVRH